MSLKLGKKPATHDPRDLRFAKYATTLTLPAPPKRFGFGRLYPDWGMLGNDSVGDCVFASAAHQTMIWNKVRHGSDVVFDDAAVLSDYSAVTGYDPADPSTDQGTDVREALKYRLSTGVVDAVGLRHKIGGFASLDAKNWDHLVLASYIFGAVEIGFEVPEHIFDAFDSGAVWDVEPGAAIVGGHDIPVVGSLDSTAKGTALSWAKRIEFTKAFYEAYNDEAYAILSLEQIRSDGRGLHGFDLATFNADLAAVSA